MLQLELGTRLGLSRTTVSNIECGSQAVSLDQAYHIAHILKVQISALLPQMEQVFSATPIHAAADDPLSLEATEQAERMVEKVGEILKESGGRTA